LRAEENKIDIKKNKVGVTNQTNQTNQVNQVNGNERVSGM